MAERIIEIDEEGNVSIPLDPQDEITQLKADLAELRLPIKSAIPYEELTETDYEILVVDYFKKEGTAQAVWWAYS